MVSLSQESIDQIRDNLNSVADTINESIDNDIQDVEKAQEKKEELLDANITKGNKSTLSNNEKRRFTLIARIFVSEWLKSLEDIERIRKRREDLVIKKRNELPKPVERAKETDKEKEKAEGTSWWGKLIAGIASLGLIYFIFQDKIKQWFPSISEFFNKAIGKVVSYGKEILGKVWEWLEPQATSLWNLIWTGEQDGSGNGGLKKLINNLWEGSDGNGGIKSWLKKMWYGEDETGKGGLRGFLLELWEGEDGNGGMKKRFLILWEGEDGNGGLRKKVFGWWEGEEGKEGVKQKLLRIWEGDDGKGGIKAVLEKLPGWTETIDRVKVLVDKILRWLDAILIGIRVAINMIFPIVRLLDLTTTVARWFTGDFPRWWKETVIPAWDKITDFFANIKDWVWDAMHDVKEWALKKWDSFVGGVKDTWENIKNTTKTGWNAAVQSGMNALGLGDKAKHLQVAISREKTETELIEQRTEKKQEAFRKQIAGIDDIVLDENNILKTIEQIANRMNLFFSDKEGSFIDLSNTIISDFNKNFEKLVSHIDKITLQQTFNIHDDDVYKDTYDYSDKSQRTINNDNRTINEQDYSINYNLVNVPAVKRALDTIDRQQQEEIRILSSQNDYLNRMVANMDGLGKKLEWLDAKKLTAQATNTIVPLIKQSQVGLGNYNATAIKGVQASIASALS